MVFIYASQAKPSGRPVGPFTGEDRPSKDAHRPGFESAVCAQHSGMSEPNFFVIFSFVTMTMKMTMTMAMTMTMTMKPQHHERR